MHYKQLLRFYENVFHTCSVRDFSHLVLDYFTF